MAEIRTISSLDAATTIADKDQLLVNVSEANNTFKTSKISPTNFGASISPYLTLTAVQVDAVPVTGGKFTGTVKFGSDIKIDPSGVQTFGSDPNNGAGPGIKFHTNGKIEACRSDGTGTIFRAFTEGLVDPTVLILGSGDATFSSFDISSPQGQGVHLGDLGTVSVQKNQSVQKSESIFEGYLGIERTSQIQAGGAANFSGTVTTGSTTDNFGIIALSGGVVSGNRASVAAQNFNSSGWVFSGSDATDVKMYITSTGEVHATKFYGDGSNLTGISGGNGGGGTVKSVNNETPDADGNVELFPNDIGALPELTPTFSGTMQGDRIDVSGDIVAKTYFGDGSNLTNLPISGLSFKGTTDVTAAPPADPAQGDFYLNTVAGDAAEGWTGIVGDAVADNEFVYYGEDEWYLGGTIDPAVVTLNTQQEISGEKLFGADLWYDQASLKYIHICSYIRINNCKCK